MSILERLKPERGLRVLITGGASGIGATLAGAFIEAGAQVHVCDISEAAIDAFAQANPAALATVADARLDADVAAVFAAQEHHFDGLDVLVNNVGIAGPTGGIDRIAPGDWENTIDINLNAQYRFARLAVPMLKRGGNGHILCMSSVAGRLGYALRTPYAATKWAIVGLMKSLSIELGGDNIRVNALLPGTVIGPRMDGVIRARAEEARLSFDEMRQNYLQKIALGRMVEAEDVAAMALFLCSPGGRNISGQAISIDGNVTNL